MRMSRMTASVTLWVSLATGRLSSTSRCPRAACCWGWSHSCACARSPAGRSTPWRRVRAVR
eukprot:scaffold36436_cov75-Phaeocystis_antarctica.AAC.2